MRHAEKEGIKKAVPGEMKSLLEKEEINCLNLFLSACSCFLSVAFCVILFIFR